MDKWFVAMLIGFLALVVWNFFNPEDYCTIGKSIMGWCGKGY